MFIEEMKLSVPCSNTNPLYDKSEHIAESRMQDAR